jgi:hypothetical protein
VLDDYWLNYVLSEEIEPGERALRTGAISGLEIHQLKSLLQILNSKTPKLSKIIHDEFSESTCATAKILQNFRDIVLEIDFQKVSFSKENIDSLMSEQNKTALSGFDLTQDDMANIDRIDFKHHISWDIFNRILGWAPKLRSMSFFSWSEKPSEKINLDEGRLIHLEDITLNYNNLSCENFETFLKAAPHLKKISISRASQLDKKFNFDEGRFTSLKEINLSNTQFSCENLDILLKAAPNLKKITLNNIRFSDKEHTLSHDNTQTLEEINLSYTQISCENLDITVIFQNT